MHGQKKLYSKIIKIAPKIGATANIPQQTTNCTKIDK
jgi:hypothetical protein